MGYQLLGWGGDIYFTLKNVISAYVADATVPYLLVKHIFE